MPFKRRDHVCGIYSTTEELAREVASVRAEGLRSHERCSYVGAREEMDSVRAALGTVGVDVSARTKRESLQLISGDGALSTHPVAYGHCGTHPFHDPSTTGPTRIHHAAVPEKIAQLDRAVGHPSTTS